MTVAEELATFVVRASYGDLSEAARRQLTMRVLDSLGCAIGALQAEPVTLVRAQLEDFDGQGHCTLIGGGRTAPDRVALYNGALVRYEVGIQFGAGGTSAAKELAAGAYMIVVESEGITKSVWVWRTDVPAKFVNTLGLDAVMFAAADPAVFAWYIKHYGPEVNLFVDHSQIVQLETLRAGIWGTKSLWGRVLTYKGEPSAGGQEKGR